MRKRVVQIFLLAIVVWVIVAWLAARLLVVSAPLDSADAIVVMSGSSAYLERTHKAAQLYREGRAPIVLLTDDHTRGGWDSAKQTNPYFVERAREELIKSGVPEDKVKIAPGIATSTREEALILKDFAESEKFQSVLIVTSSYHSRRALRSMQQVLSTNGTTVGLELASDPPEAFWWLRPEGWRTVGSEYAKLIYYWFKYD